MVESQEALDEIVSEISNELVKNTYHLGKGKRVILIEDESNLLEIILQNDEFMEVYIDILHYKLNSRKEPTDIQDIYSEKTTPETIHIIYNLLNV
jgi:hypothetical protein